MTKKLWLLCLFAIVLPVSAQQASLPEGFEHWTPGDFSHMKEELTTKAAKDSRHSASQSLADFSNDLFMLGHREDDGEVEWHETQADVFFVQSGSATLIVGGKQVNGHLTSPHEMRGGTIEGGIRQKLSVGDVIRIPAKMPHQLLLDGAHEFTYFVIKIKGY